MLFGVDLLVRGVLAAILGLMGGQMLTKVVLSIVLIPWLITGLVRLGHWLDEPRAA